LSPSIRSVFGSFLSLFSSGIGKTLILSVITTLVMLSDDFLQKLYTQNNQAELEAEYVLVLWVVNLCLWLSGRRWFINIVLLLFATMQLLQLSHIAFIGSPITPFDLSKLVEEWWEISTTVNVAFAEQWPVLLAWGIPYASLFLIFNWGVPRWCTPRSWIALLIVVLIIGSKPERAARRDMIAFMPGPTRSSLHNSINVFSYYFTRMAGDESTVKRPDYVPYRMESEGQSDRPENIIIVIPDSTRSERMSAYGYTRNTTPYLKTLRRKNEAQFLKGIASSVATGSSLPLFFNVVNEPGNVSELERGVGNLFRRASEAGYKTFWLSTHESKMLNGVGSRYIDVSLTKEDDPVGYAAQGDRVVLDWLRSRQWETRNFIVIPLRSVHTPYKDAYDQSENPVYRTWPSRGDSLSSDQKRSNAYDNALIYLDALIRDLNKTLKASLPGDSVWIVTSDHGQMLGEDGRWGHNRLTKRVADVPMIIGGWRDSAADEPYQLPDTDYLSHYELGKWLLSLMNYRLINPNEQPGLHFLHSEKLYADNLFTTIVERPKGLVFCNKQLLSKVTALTPCKVESRSLAGSQNEIGSAQRSAL